MILSNKIKSIILYKVDRLVRETIISIYLNCGFSDQSLNEMGDKVNPLLYISSKINNDEEIKCEDLKLIELEYKIYQPYFITNTKHEFEF